MRSLALALLCLSACNQGGLPPLGDGQPYAVIVEQPAGSAANVWVVDRQGVKQDDLAARLGIDSTDGNVRAFGIGGATFVTSGSPPPGIPNTPQSTTASYRAPRQASAARVVIETTRPDGGHRIVGVALDGQKVFDLLSEVDFQRIETSPSGRWLVGWDFQGFNRLIDTQDARVIASGLGSLGAFSLDEERFYVGDLRGSLSVVALPAGVVAKIDPPPQVQSADFANGFFFPIAVSNGMLFQVSASTPAAGVWLLSHELTWTELAPLGDQHQDSLIGLTDDQQHALIRRATGPAATALLSVDVSTRVVHTSKEGLYAGGSVHRSDGAQLLRWTFANATEQPIAPLPKLADDFTLQLFGASRDGRVFASIGLARRGLAILFSGDVVIVRDGGRAAIDLKPSSTSVAIDASGRMALAYGRPGEWSVVDVETGTVTQIAGSLSAALLDP